MRNKNKITVWLNFRFNAVLLGLVLLALAGSRATEAQGQNLLVNPSFEGQYSGYVPETGAEQADCSLGVCNTAQVPDGWKPWWIKERPTDVNPEYKPAEGSAAGSRVRSGGRAAQYFSFWSTHKAGLRQQVTVPANATVRFTVWGQAWLSESDSSLTSDHGATVNMRVGIDPTGGSNPYNPAIVWSGFQQPFDAYQLFTVEAQAQGEHVTVFTFAAPDVNPGSPEYGFKHNDIYWDDASLEVIGGGSAPPPAPAPIDDGNTGNTAPPAAPPAAPPQLGPSPTPDAEGVIAVIVQPGDSLWAIAARHGLTLDELLELNNLTRNDFINAGDRIIVGHGEPGETEPTEAESLSGMEETGDAVTAAENEDEDAAAEEPTATATPLPAATATPAVSEKMGGGALCLTAFNDSNEDGSFDSNETLRDAVAVTVSDGEQVVSNYITDGISEPYCINGLEAGDYRVTRSSRANERMTTASDWEVSLKEGGTVDIEFGSVIEAAEVSDNNQLQIAGAVIADEAAAQEAAERAANQASSTGTSGLVIAVVVVAVLLLVGVLVMILSSRRSTV